MCELIRFRSEMRSRCSDDVSMLSSGVAGEPAEMRIGVRTLEVAKQHLLREQFLRALQVAVQEDAHAQPEIGDQPRVQVADLRHAGVGKTAVLRDLLVLDVVRARAR